VDFWYELVNLKCYIFGKQTSEFGTGSWRLGQNSCLDIHTSRAAYTVNNKSNQIVNLKDKENWYGEKMQETQRKDSTEVYKDHNTQALIGKFLSGEINSLEPVYDSKTGYGYPPVEAIIGEASKVEAFLDLLYQEKILQRKLIDKVIFCPKCASAEISFRYSCPYCKSFDVHKSSLIEHVKCGYMDLEENFRKGAELICPKCHQELKKIDIDHRKAGVWCACRECKKSFDVPVPEHYCKSCRAVTNFEQAVIRDVYSYTLDEHVKERLSSSLFLVAPIRKLLMEQGLTVESPAFLEGKSGAKHSFDVVAFKGEKPQKVIVVDLAFSTEALVSEQPVIALFAKIFDVSPDKAFLVAIPKLSSNGRKMAELYNIQAIEAKSQAEAVAFLKSKLEGKV